MSTPGIIVEGDAVEVFLKGTAGDDSFSGTWLGEAFYTGLGNDNVYAGDGGDIVIADLGNDTLDGGAGADMLNFAFVNADRAGNAAYSSMGVKFDLTKHVQDLGYFGVKTIYGFEDVTGTSSKDSIWGDNRANKLLGIEGNDALNGRGGADSIDGGLGRDTIVGGAGADQLAGNEGGVGDQSRDVFRFKAASDSGIAANARDHIYGVFNGQTTATGDVIDLHLLDANGSAAGNGAFHFIGTGSFHANSTGEIQVKATANANEYLVKVDMDNDTGAEMSFIVHSGTALTANDFIL